MGRESKEVKAQAERERKREHTELLGLAAGILLADHNDMGRNPGGIFCDALVALLSAYRATQAGDKEKAHLLTNDLGGMAWQLAIDASYEWGKDNTNE